ncbi:MAG: COX15/CtaA family protein [Planctomycetota bacterium]
MTSESTPSQPEETRRLYHLRKWVLLTALLNFAGLIQGGAVTSTDSALVDPHWPSFEGEVVPSPSRMTDSWPLFFEHTHRILMGSVGILTLICTIAIWRSTRRRDLRSTSRLALILVTIIATMGGLTVLLGKSTWVSVIHVSLAMMYVLAMWKLVVLLGHEEPLPTEKSAATKTLRILSTAAVHSIVLQVILGAIPRHATQEAGGRTLVLVGDGIHIAWAFAVFTLVILTYLEASKHYRPERRVFRPAVGLVFLIVAQVFLGFAAFVVQPKDPPSVQDLYPASAQANADAGGDGNEATPASPAGEATTEVAAAPAPERKVAGQAERSHALTASAHQVLGIIILITAWVLSLRVRRLTERPEAPSESELT